MENQMNTPRRRNPRLPGPGDLSFSTCVKTLSNVNISRRGLLNLEMSVGLAIFLDFGTANRAAKQMVAEVYQKAGYDCETSEGKDYKTVNRRIQASAALFGKITPEVITSWIDGKKENKLLQAIAHKLAGFNFGSMDDILDYVGRVSNRTSEKEPSPFDIDLGENVVVHIPRKLNEAQLIELASKIMALAEEVRAASFVERRVNNIPVQEERRKHMLH